MHTPCLPSGCTNSLWVPTGAQRNDINPRHVLLQPPQQGGGRRRYMLIDYGGAACPRLADPAIEPQICPPAQDIAPMLDVRPSVLDPLCGSLQSVGPAWPPAIPGL